MEPLLQEVQLPMGMQVHRGPLGLHHHYQLLLLELLRHFLLLLEGLHQGG
jgi:hypothetical protein